VVLLFATLLATKTSDNADVLKSVLREVDEVLRARNEPSDETRQASNSAELRGLYDKYHPLHESLSLSCPPQVDKCIHCDKSFDAGSGDSTSTPAREGFRCRMPGCVPESSHHLHWGCVASLLERGYLQCRECRSFV